MSTAVRARMHLLGGPVLVEGRAWRLAFRLRAMVSAAIVRELNR